MVKSNLGVIFDNIKNNKYINEEDDFVVDVKWLIHASSDAYTGLKIRPVKKEAAVVFPVATSVATNVDQQNIKIFYCDYENFISCFKSLFGL